MATISSSVVASAVKQSIQKQLWIQSSSSPTASLLTTSTSLSFLRRTVALATPPVRVAAGGGSSVLRGGGGGVLRSTVPNKSQSIVDSSADDLLNFICEGPLIPRLGYTVDEVSSDIDQWLQCGFHLCRLFDMSQLNLSIAQKARIYHYYIPVFFWCQDQIRNHRSQFRDGDDIPPCVVSIMLFSLHPLLSIASFYFLLHFVTAF